MPMLERSAKMNEERKVEDPVSTVLLLAIYLASLFHVFTESKRMNDAAIRNTFMVALCVWPLGYALWTFYWPGTLWRKFTGRKRLEQSLASNFDRKDKYRKYNQTR